MDRKPYNLQIVSLQMARTGSFSMYNALGILGYKNVYHSLNMQERPGDTEKYLAVLRKKYYKNQPLTKPDIDPLIHDREAVLSAPYWGLWREMMDFYPDAKFILVERDVDAWYKSLLNIVEVYIYHWYTVILIYYAQPLLGRHDMETTALCMRGGMDCWTREEIRARAKENFREHERGVKEKAEKEGRELLVYRLGEGWGPLCEFLGKEIPGTPFPRTNDSKDLTTKLRRTQHEQIRDATIVLAKYVAGVTAAAVAVYWYRFRS